MLKIFKVKYYVVFLFVFVLLSHKVRAQDTTKSALSIIELGGSLSFAFGSETYFDIAPLIGYRVHKSIIISGGYIYRYAQINSGFLKYKTNSHGWRANVKIDVLPPLFIIGEYQKITLDGWNYSLGMPGRVNPTIIFLGAGYTQKISPRTSLEMSMLFDVYKDVNNPYPLPYFRGGLSWKLKKP